MAAREADLLPVGYFHVVFTVPAEIADIAWQNKAVVLPRRYASLHQARVWFGVKVVFQVPGSRHGVDRVAAKHHSVSSRPWLRPSTRNGDQHGQTLRPYRRGEAYGVVVPWWRADPCSDKPGIAERDQPFSP